MNDFHRCFATRTCSIGSRAALLLGLLAVMSCNAKSNLEGGQIYILDDDGDGFTGEQDCNDQNRYIHMGAIEPCDAIDNDCDLRIDESFDQDEDGWTTCQGDCRDGDDTSNPNTLERPDGLDNDCDGLVDNGTVLADDDGDGYSEDQGDCNDDIQTGFYTNPAAVEVVLNVEGGAEGLDNDCDSLIDEALPPCPSGGDSQDPMSYVNAIDACHFVLAASWDNTLNIDPRSRRIHDDFGATYVPRAGAEFAVLSSGIAVPADDPAFVSPQSGTSFINEVPHPDPQGAMGCSDADEGTVNDYSEVVMRLKVPSNAVAFSFDFNFMSVEFPEYVCQSFDDTFLALLESEEFIGNVSFDAQGNRVSINVGFFDVCDEDLGDNCTGNEPLIGTGHEYEGGGTGWLTTTAPVKPGEKMTLRFVIFDEGDHILDSTVLIDNFRWEVDDILCPDGSPPPCTIGRERASTVRVSTAAQYPIPGP